MTELTDTPSRRHEVRSFPSRRPRPWGDRSQPGANQYDLGSFNEATIIETIRLAGTITRT